MLEPVRQVPLNLLVPFRVFANRSIHAGVDHSIPYFSGNSISTCLLAPCNRFQTEIGFQIIKSMIRIHAILACIMIYFGQAKNDVGQVKIIINY